MAILSLKAAVFPAAAAGSIKPRVQARAGHVLAIRQHASPAPGPARIVPVLSSRPSVANLRRSVTVAMATPEDKPGSSSEASKKPSDTVIIGGTEVMRAGTTKNRQRGAAVYGTLAWIFLAVGIAKAAAPGAALELVYNACGDSACQLFTRLCGVLLLLPAAALQSLKDAAANGRLASATYERLNMSLLVASLGLGGLAVAAAKGSALATTNAIWGVVAICVLTAVAASHVLAKGEAGLLAVAFRVPSEGLQLFKPANGAAAMYSVLTLAVLAMAGALLYAPGPLHSFLFNEPSSIGALMEHIKRSIGVLLLAAAATTFTLKDAADRSRLGASTFKLLNLAFSVCAAATFGAMVWYIQNFAGAQYSVACIGMLGVQLVAALTCGFQSVAAKK